jgi:hypothetical protein
MSPLLSVPLSSLSLDQHLLSPQALGEKVMWLLERMFLAVLVGRGFARQIISAWNGLRWMKSRRLLIENWENSLTNDER